MIIPIKNLFHNKRFISVANNVIPELFYIAEKEAAKKSTHGPEVGCVREKQLLSCLMEFLGEKNVNTDIPALEPEVDSKVFKKPLGVKTFTQYSQIRMIWTVDQIKAEEFVNTYLPKCDILLSYIKWNNTGKRLMVNPGLYYIPVEIIRPIFFNLGPDRYFNLPKAGTNPRGVSLSTEALKELVAHKDSEFIPIYWRRPTYETDGYQRWRQILRPAIKSSGQFKSSFYKQNYM